MSKIYIDVGHGGIDSTGSDTGATAIQNIKYYENNFNLLIANACADKLRKYGHNVTLSRTTNSNIGGMIGSYSRADSNLINSANKCKAGDYDFMLSIHCNSYNTKASGYVIIYKAGDKSLVDASKKLADSVGAKLNNVITKNDIRTNLQNGKDYYGILRLHNKAGILVECAFMDNPKDLKLLIDKSNDFGVAIADGIIGIYGGKDESIKPQPQSAPNEAIKGIVAEIDKIKSQLDSIKKQIESL